MNAVTVSEMRDAEHAAMAADWTKAQLLTLAGNRLGHAIGRYFSHPGTVIGYLGKGHNAGDALVALAVLRDHYGWEIATRNAYPIEEFSPLTRMKWEELGLQAPLTAAPTTDDLGYPLVLLDGLLGIGSSGAMRSPLPLFAAEMEWLRKHRGAKVAAVDLPSGIDADTGIATPGTVTADVTFMIGNAKHGILTSHAANFTGALAHVPVEPLQTSGNGELVLISPQTMDFGKTPRPFDFHKGLAGRVAIIAGSKAYTGAAVLAATGALRGGAGLVTLIVPPEIHPIIAAKCPPEVIVRNFSSWAELHDPKVDAWVIGCGIGELNAETEAAMIDFIANLSTPTVIDADALNAIAKSGKTGILKENHLITPHPGEFQRLAPDLADMPREVAARAFTDRSPCTLLLKGCRTLVTRREHPIWCNATGTPGMATGGQGDLLAGVIGARLAGGDPINEAAALSAWICGRAAEKWIAGLMNSEESLLPSDVASQLGAVFLDWKCSLR
ncbi:MAG: NAD(P)H-hydrate dehydratase [Verrucomicrobiota bacterium]